MGRLFMLLAIAALGYWCYQTGIFYSVTHNFEPEPKRAAVLHGLRKDGVKFALEKENMNYVLDSQIGTPGQKMEAALRLSAAMNQGLVGELPENTKCTVISSTSSKMYMHSYPLVKVEINGGEYDGTQVYVQREDVIDSPMMEGYAAMRNAGKKEK